MFSGYSQVWVACGWKTFVDTATFFSGLKVQLDHPQLVTRRAKGVEDQLDTIKLRWSELRPLLEREIDVGDVESDGKTVSDGILSRINIYIFIFRLPLFSR